MNRTISEKLHSRSIRATLFADHGPLTRGFADRWAKTSGNVVTNESTTISRATRATLMWMDVSNKEDEEGSGKMLEKNTTRRGHRLIARSITEIADEILHNHDAVADLLEHNSAFYITPRSTFMKVWDFVIGSLLVYTALMTPFEIAFLTDEVGVAQTT